MYSGTIICFVLFSIPFLIIPNISLTFLVTSAHWIDAFRANSNGSKVSFWSCNSYFKTQHRICIVEVIFLPCELPCTCWYWSSSATFRPTACWALSTTPFYTALAFMKESSIQSYGNSFFFKPLVKLKTFWTSNYNTSNSRISFCKKHAVSSAAYHIDPMTADFILYNRFYQLVRDGSETH